MLQALGGVAATATFACDDSATPTDTGGGGAGLGGADGGAGGDTSNGGAAQGAGGDGGDGGSVPATPCNRTSDLGAADLLEPIDTIVVLCMENRSFDHYFGSLALKEGHPSDGLDGTESNPDPMGAPVPVFRLENFTPEDPPHEWEEVHDQWNAGKNNGFVIAHQGPSQNEVMGYHERDQLPVLYALADEFTICDRWFCSLLGPTWPNRFYLHGATSGGEKGNWPSGITSIFELLAAEGVTSRNYFHDIPWRATAYGAVQGNSGIETFFEEAMAGTLPRFSIIDPQFFGDGANDDHPDHDITLGQALIASIYAALAQSPQWNRCLFIITYDEHGGFYDHVPPPETVDELEEFKQLGFRVPSVIIGPYVRRGCVESTQLEHVSVIKTLTVRWDLPSLNARVDATADVSGAIDPATLESPRPAPPLPMVNVSLSRLAERAKLPQKDHHPEMRKAADAGLIPRHLDRRADADAITRRVLAWGERLGAVKIVP